VRYAVVLPATGARVKLPICLALIALLSACIPIGIRGTSIVDSGIQHPVAASPSGDAAPNLPASRAPDPQRA
jgi:hypothetical protein